MKLRLNRYWVALALLAVAGAFGLRLNTSSVPLAKASGLSWSGYSWNVFHGTGRLGQVWSPTHVKINNGTLDENMSNRVGGGIGMRLWRTYGTYTATYRVTRGGGKYVFLLFGKAPHDEIDFGESKPADSNRTTLTGTLHYGASNSEIHVQTTGDFTQSHVLSLVWHPGILTFKLNGSTWATITQHVPSAPMHMTIQTNANVGTSAASDLYVSSVHIAP